MSQPSRRLDKKLDELLQNLPPQYPQMMKELKAFCRTGKIKTMQDLIRVILLYCGMDYSARDVAGIFTLTDERITDDAILQRLAKCTDFLEAMVKHSLKLERLPQLPAGRPIYCIDGATIEGLGSEGTAFRLHLCINLLTLQLAQVNVLGAKIGESLKNYEIVKGALYISDRAYCCYSDIMDLVYDHDADILTRWNWSVPLRDAQDPSKIIDLEAILKDQEVGSIQSLEVILKYCDQSKKKDDRQVSGWVHIYRMDSEQVEAAQRRVKKKHNKKQRPLSRRTLFFSQFVIVFTSLPPSILCAQDALALYRCRWQVELFIKRLRGSFSISKLRAGLDARCTKAYLYGKLLYVILVEKQMDKAFGRGFVSLEPQRKLTAWRPCKLAKALVDAALLQLQRWRQEALAECVEVLQERPRLKRKLQILPEAVLGGRARELLELIA